MGRLIDRDYLETYVKEHTCQISVNKLLVLKSDETETERLNLADAIDEIPTATAGKLIDTDDVRACIGKYPCNIDEKTKELLLYKDNRWKPLSSEIPVRNGYEQFREVYGSYKTYAIQHYYDDIWTGICNIYNESRDNREAPEQTVKRCVDTYGVKDTFTLFSAMATLHGKYFHDGRLYGKTLDTMVGVYEQFSDENPEITETLFKKDYNGRIREFGLTRLDDIHSAHIQQLCSSLIKLYMSDYEKEPVKIFLEDEITREMIAEGFKNGTVSIEDDTSYCIGLCCRIGDNSFYFANIDDDTLTAKEYLEKYSQEEIVDKLYDILKDEVTAEAHGLGREEYHISKCRLLEPKEKEKPKSKDDMER
jgi:hypothetical protein